MESVPTTDIDSLRLRYRAINANRPTVIIFSDLQNKEAGRGDHEAKRPHSIFPTHATETSTFCRAREMEVQDPCESEDDEQYERNTQDRTHFRRSDDILDNNKPRQRTSFTKLQRIRLEEEFNRDAYIIGMKRWRLSEELEVPEKKIKIWFQNRRTKMKKGY